MATTQMKKWLAQVALVVSVAGCATSAPIPEPSDPGSVGVAIEVTLQAPAGAFIRESPDQVFFAKIDEGTGILQQQFIRSNLVKDSRAYLLNASPGTYVAVGAFFRGPMGTGGSFTTYFSQAIIESSLVTAQPGELVYMGSFDVHQSIGLSGADAAQTHYQNVISPGAVTSGVLPFFTLDYHYRGNLLERKADEQTRSDFRAKAAEDLSGTTWATRVK